MAIIIDDVGIKSYSALEDLLNINIPITFAVLPYQRFTKSCSTK